MNQGRFSKKFQIFRKNNNCCSVLGEIGNPAKLQRCSSVMTLAHREKQRSHMLSQRILRRTCACYSWERAQRSVEGEAGRHDSRMHAACRCYLASAARCSARSQHHFTGQHPCGILKPIGRALARAACLRCFRASVFMTCLHALCARLKSTPSRATVLRAARSPKNILTHSRHHEFRARTTCPTRMAIHFRL